MIDIEAKYLDQIKRILSAQIPGYEVWAFGSRVNGRAKKYSDLDLVVTGAVPLDWRKLEGLKTAFSESDLPFMVDVLDWHSIRAEFRRVIKERYEVLQK
ncbi:MAG: nucleotidyltransferase domain-containing protein [Candidatus Schekmanbacteria bacterium]|nr:nucleotidyltransferase domain-containing protein [Candidatus Schekmanbacteria bacterium]